MLEFATYLKETFNQDVSKAEDIIKEKWNKVKAIMKEAFDGPYADKQTALNRIQNDFIDKTIAPSTIDVDFLKNNMEYVVEKINALDEGDIKIIINNDTNKSGKGGMAEPTVTTIPSVTPIYTTDDETDIDMETESAKAKKKGKKGKKAEKEEEEELEEKAEKPEVPEVTDEPEETPAEEVTPDAEPEETTEETPEDKPEETTDIEAKKLTITVTDNKVTVDPENEDTGLEHKDYEFESPTQAQKFADSLKQFFGEQGFEITDKSEATPEGEDKPEETPEDEVTPDETPEGAEDEEGVISWEDVEGEEVPEDEEDDEDVAESLDINKLVGKLIRVGDKWYNVTSIAESKLVCVDKDGNESKFSLTEVEEAEVDKDEEKKEKEEAEEKAKKEEAEKKEAEEKAKKEKEEAEEKEEAAEEKADEKEEVEEALSITKIASKFMFDDDDTVDESETPKMPSVDKAFTKTKEPSAALTATPKKPNEKVEKTNKPETMSKKAPSAALTAKPSKPKEKVETVKTPKVEKKAPPKANLTAKPAKPNEKIETVKAPSFDAEYNKK